MDKNLISLEGDGTILNVNAIAMVFPEDGENDTTCINIIGGNRMFYIKEKYENIKKKLSDWMTGEE